MKHSGPSHSIPCPDCNRPISEVEEKCGVCGYNAGAPNVRAAKHPEEVDALKERYDVARCRSAAKGSLPNLDEFEASMRGTCAVINADPRFVFTFLSSRKALYSTYKLSVEGETRALAEPDDDRHREGVEAVLFGSYGKQIRYAALSIDGEGLSSYGTLAMRLWEVAIRKRSSLLEENSYDFVDHYNLRPGCVIPPGYRAPWEERHKLAVAKLADDVLPTTSSTEHAGILLSSNGSRSADRFVEVHIFGPFNADAIESVRGCSNTKGQKQDIARIKNTLAKAGKSWVEG